MDFPQFFRTAISQAQIGSQKWRGLALLCKPSDTFKSLRGTYNEDQVMPARGSEFTDRDIALHVLHKPFMTVSLNGAGGASILVAKPGVRYYIHSVFMSLRQVVTDDNTQAYITYTQNGSSQIPIFINPVPLMAASYNVSMTPDILTDTNTVVSIVTATVNFAALRTCITYAEIGAS